METTTIGYMLGLYQFRVDEGLGFTRVSGLGLRVHGDFGGRTSVRALGIL